MDNCKVRAEIITDNDDDDDDDKMIFLLLIFIFFVKLLSLKQQDIDFSSIM